MTRWLAVVLLFCAPLSLAVAHIEANVPPQQSFEGLLNRDLLSFFKSTSEPGATRVQYRLLRDAPTQSGVAFPKYYAWVEVFVGSRRTQEGAVRLAAVSGHHFDVTHFFSAQQIRTSASEVATVFPPPLVSVVIERAGAK
jgi:hypothetical protein